MTLHIPKRLCIQLKSNITGLNQIGFGVSC